MLASKLGLMLRTRNLTVSLAESCTGGRLGDKITDVSGSSDYFVGGVISYSNDAKVRLLGVRKATLASRGAVSKEVAIQMADGVRREFRTALGVGITGIAGPMGGSRSKPIGLVYIAVSSSGSSAWTKNLFRGSRNFVKSQSTEKAIQMLEEFVERNF